MIAPTPDGCYRELNGLKKLSQQRRDMHGSRPRTATDNSYRFTGSWNISDKIQSLLPFAFTQSSRTTLPKRMPPVPAFRTRHAPLRYSRYLPRRRPSFSSVPPRVHSIRHPRNAIFVDHEAAKRQTLNIAHRIQTCDSDASRAYLRASDTKRISVNRFR
jgi:hypothetical protein